MQASAENRLTTGTESPSRPAWQQAGFFSAIYFEGEWVRRLPARLSRTAEADSRANKSVYSSLPD
jgi:hypothetical protein